MHQSCLTTFSDWRIAPSMTNRLHLAKLTDYYACIALPHVIHDTCARRFAVKFNRLRYEIVVATVSPSWANGSHCASTS